MCVCIMVSSCIFSMGVDLYLCALMQMFVPFSASRHDLQHHPCWSAAALQLEAQREGSSPVGHGCCWYVLLLAGTRHLHHTLTTAGIV